MPHSSLIPFDARCPVIYDNDAHSDAFTDEYLLALASAGEIDLRGLITSSPANPYVSRATFDFDACGRAELVEKARRSGMKNLPPAVIGCPEKLLRPASNRIEDTTPQDSPGTQLILAEARRATPDRPLVVVMGGTLTAAVSAYLLEPSIADRIVISIVAGSLQDMDDYNAWTDPWAGYILIERLHALLFPGGPPNDPLVPPERLLELPDCEYRQWMLDKQLPHVQLPGGRDGDGSPAVALMLPDYVLATKGVACGGWKQATFDNRLVPVYRDAPASRARVVTHLDAEAGTREFWRALTNPLAWGDGPRQPAAPQRPFYACPFPLGVIRRIEAEDFDHGGEGRGYHLLEARRIHAYRPEAVPIAPAGDIPGGYNLGAGGGFAVSELQAGEWLAYTVDLPRAGNYTLGVRLAAAGPAGFFHLEVDQTPVTPRLPIPVTGGIPHWQTLSCHADLPTGRHILRIVMDSGAGSFNYVEL